MASEIKVDTVSEKTSGSGVTIDSVLLKDNKVDVNGTAGGIILDADADTHIGANTDDVIVFTNAGTGQVTLSDGAFSPVTDNDVDLGTSSLEFKDGYFDGTLHCDVLDLAGTEYTSIGGSDPSSADGDSLGTASLEWSDLFLADGGIVYFGNDQDIRLTHNADKGLILKHTATADDKPVILTLQTGETDMAANDVIGKIEFQAPDEGTGTDAVLVSGAIQAVAEGDHSSSSNATRLEFMTGASEAATAKMSISSGGIVGIGATLPGDLGEGLHIKTSDTGGGAANNSKELVIESNHASGGGMTITSKNDATGRIQFGDGDANSRFEVSYNHSTDKFQLSTAAAVAVAIDQDGIVTKPLQPAVLYSGNDEDNFTGDGTALRLGIDSGVGTTERFDVNADQSTGTFTAPVTGKYLIAGQIWIDDIQSNHSDFLIQMTTSNRTYYVALNPHELARSSGNSLGIPFCAFADMDANDTHILTVSVSGGSKVVDLVSLTQIGITLLS